MEKEYRQQTNGTEALSTIESSSVPDRAADLERFVQDAQVAETSPAFPESYFRIKTCAEFLSAPEPEYVVHGLIKPGDTVMIVGDPGTGKSFQAATLMGQIARGSGLYAGKFEVLRPANVLYAAAEGQVGLRDRIRAQIADLGLDEPERARMFFLEVVPNLFGPEDALDGLRPFIDELMRNAIEVIFIDTLALAMSGSDENHASDATLVMKRIVQLKRDIPGLIVLPIHHAKKDTAEPRGSSALKAGADVVLGITATKDGKRTLKCIKNKDGEPFRDITFRIVRSRNHSRSAVIEWLSEFDGQSGSETRPGRALEGLVIGGLERLHESGLAWVTTRVLAECLDKPPSTVDSCLKRLESSGLVQSRIGPTTAKEYRLSSCAMPQS